jgi:hypothetical protein
MKFQFMMIFLKMLNLMRKCRTECKPCHLTHRWGLHLFKDIGEAACQRFYKVKCRLHCQNRKKPLQGLKLILRIKSSDKDKLKDSEIPPQNTEGSQTKEPGTEKGKGLETSPIILDDIPEKIGGTASKELGSPITALTPLQSTFGTPHEGVLYVSDLEPISRDEIPHLIIFSAKNEELS